MSGRYPTGISASWFPHTIYIYFDATRDVYGRVTEEGPRTETKAKVKRRPVEMIENGARVLREGASVKVADARRMEQLDIGTIIEYGDANWTVIGLNEHPDHTGTAHFWMLNVVKKASDSSS